MDGLRLLAIGGTVEQIGEADGKGECAEDDERIAKKGQQAGETVHGRMRKSRVGLLYKVLE